jgi:hypothetical protein
MNRLPSALLLAVALPVLGCMPTATAQQVRRTSDGGTLIVGGGSGVPAAMRQAVSAIEQHCRGVYEVVEIAQVATGQVTSSGVAYSIGPVAFGSSGSSPIYGTSIAYLCREPASTALNEWVVQVASADIVGRKCRADADCGPLFCARTAPSDEQGVCSPR